MGGAVLVQPDEYTQGYHGESGTKSSHLRSIFVILNLHFLELQFYKLSNFTSSVFTPLWFSQFLVPLHLKNSNHSASVNDRLILIAGTNWWVSGNSHSGYWAWTGVTNSRFSYTNWGRGEPNNRHRGSEGCVALWNRKGHRWNDEYCYTELYFICEKWM